MEPIIVSVSNVNKFGFVIHGENLAEQFGFDFTEWVEAYGAGTISMRLRRNGDANPYPVILTTEGNIAIWSPTETDTARSGLAKAQLIYTAGETIAKTLVFGVRVAPSLGPTTDPPEPFEDWLDQLTDLAAETQQNAEDAAQSATDANEAKGEAIQAKNDAVTAKGEAEEAKRNAVTAQGKAEEAQHNAEEAVAHYPKIESGYWYVWQNDGWVNTGVKAEGSDGIGITSITSVKSSTSGLVDTYTVTVTYDDNNTDTYTFTVTNGRDGTDGITPTVTVTSITGGHNVAFSYGTGDPRNTDFDVMDGEVSTADLTAVANSKAPVIIDTASGSIASFPDGADDMPMKQIVGEIVPVQDLNGYDNPWPAGGGKNMIDSSTNIAGSIITSTGGKNDVSDQNISITLFIPVEPSTTYTQSGCGNVNAYASKRGAEYSSEDLSTFTQSIDGQYADGTFTTGANTHYVRLNVLTANAGTCMLEKGSTKTTYAPYSNICPISGWTVANVTRTGKNLFAGDIRGGYIETSHKIAQYSQTGNAWKLAVMPCKPNSTYTVSFDGTVTRNVFAYINEEPATGVATYGDTSTVAQTKTITTGANAKYVICYFWNTNSDTGTQPNVQIELGSTATSYSPYTGTTLPITWQSHGTKYDGYFTINEDGSVKLMSSAVSRHFSDLTWTANASYANTFNGEGFTTRKARIDGSNANGCYCDSYKWYTSSEVGTSSGGIALANASSGTLAAMTRIYVKDTRFSTKDEFVASFATYDPLVVCPAQTPITYTLSDVTILNTLLGQNNVWCDTGSVECLYRADTRLYIDKKLAALVAALS